MVIVRDGKASIIGDSLDIAIDVMTFMGSIVEMKQRDYEGYEQLLTAMKGLVEVDSTTIDIMKDFTRVMMKTII